MRALLDVKPLIFMSVVLAARKPSTITEISGFIEWVCNSCQECQQESTLLHNNPSHGLEA